MNLQFQGWFISISLRPVLGIGAVNVMAAVWSLCSLLLRPGGGFSVYKTVHRVWLRILSLAPEKELKTLDYAYDYIISTWFSLTVFLCFCIFSLLQLNLFFG